MFNMNRVDLHLGAHTWAYIRWAYTQFGLVLKILRYIKLFNPKSLNIMTDSKFTLYSCFENHKPLCTTWSPLKRLSLSAKWCSTSTINTNSEIHNMDHALFPVLRGVEGNQQYGTTYTSLKVCVKKCDVTRYQGD